MALEFNEYVRKPFVVEATEVTEANMAEIAQYVGDIETKPDGTRFIKVDRRMVPNVYRVFPGYFMTRMGDNVRCYSRKVFVEQFIPMTEEIGAWVKFINTDEPAKDEAVAPMEVGTTNA